LTDAEDEGVAMLGNRFRAFATTISILLFVGIATPPIANSSSLSFSVQVKPLEVEPPSLSGNAYDLIIKHGRIIDGAGNPRVSGDLAIQGDRIAAIGRLEGAKAKRVIDAAGLVVSPGFIDMLGQSEMALLIDNRALSKLSQGITTEITGEGASIAPQDAFTLSALVPELDHYHLKVD
jgi:N-acyl-D-amino-acid deacylase